MDINLTERLSDGIFSKALQVRRMIQRGSRDLAYLPLAEIVALGKRVESLLSPEELAEGATAVAGERWHRPTIEMNVIDGYAEWRSTTTAKLGQICSSHSRSQSRWS